MMKYEANYRLHAAVKPIETLLSCRRMTGQTPHTAKAFK